MKKILICLFCATLLTLTGCAKKCPSGYSKENGKCVQYVESPESLHVEYTCDEEWELKEGECVNGTMPPIGDGCEPETNDRIGEDGFCHHYKQADIKYSCFNNTILKTDKCYVKNVK